MEKHSINIVPVRCEHIISAAMHALKKISSWQVHVMSKRIIAVVHDAPVPAGHSFSEASLDVHTHVENIENALVELGHPATVLELLAIPFSGSPSMALMLTTDKVMTKRLLIAKGIRTPDYLIYNGTEKFNVHILSFPVIIKPRFKDASIGIDQDSVFQDEEELKRGLRDFFDRFGTILVEEYIAGREFNVSLFGYPSASLLPISEIDFSDFPEGRYPIVDYRAKWLRDSLEYQHTPRKFPQELPHALLKNMESTALESFRLLMLRDYARVDIRVDGSGRIHVLEVDANPCLSPDAEFSAAAREAEIEYPGLVSGMIDFMLQRATKNG